MVGQLIDSGKDGLRTMASIAKDGLLRPVMVDWILVNNVNKFLEPVDDKNDRYERGKRLFCVACDVL